MTLPNQTGAVLAYGGATFSDSDVETISVDARPVPDSAGRAVVYVEYDLTLRLWVSVIVPQVGPPLPSTDSTIASLRQQLTKPGQAFYYQNRGFGDLVINVQPGGGPVNGHASVVRDAVWGPWPTLLKAKPLGNDQSWEIVWSVKVRVPECPSARYANYPMEQVYRLTYDEDASGYTKRTHSGHLRIPQSRRFAAAVTLADNADRYRERINPPLLPGFRRIPGTFTLDESKCRLDYTITDVEVGPNYLPPGIVDAHISHRVGSTKGLPWVGSAAWGSVLSGEYEMARDADRATAFNHFVKTLTARMNTTRGVVPSGLVDAKGTGMSAQSVFLTSFEMEEPDVYDRPRARFTATYTYLASVNTILSASGLWTPVPDSDWQRWARSLNGSAFALRGTANLSFDQTSDVIISLCDSGASPPAPPRANNIQRTIRPGRTQIKNRTPDPKASWLAYVAWVTLSAETNTVPLVPLPPSDLRPNRTDPDVLVIGGPTFGEGSVPSPQASETAPLNAQSGAASNNEIVVQQRAVSVYYARLRGYAIRAGHFIDPPTVISVGGARATLVSTQDEGMSQSVVASLFGVPIYAATWNLYYILDQKPVGKVVESNYPYIG